MIKTTLLVFLLVATPIRCLAVDVDEIFNAQDVQSLTSTSIENKILSEALESKNITQQRLNEINLEKENAAKIRAAEYQSQRAVGNGNRYYLCEYSCRTSGFLSYEGTDKSKITVKADESWQAQDKAERQAKEICGNIRGTTGFSKGMTMYTNNIRCEEIR